MKASLRMFWGQFGTKIICFCQRARGRTVEERVKNGMFSTSTRMEVSLDYYSTLDTTMREEQEVINLSRRSSGGGWRRVA